MREALALAREAAEADEVPVGAVVVHDGRVVGRGANRQIRDADPTAHAEIVALRQAAREIGDHRLRDATVYSTLEPCAMCAGALVTARIARLVFGSRDLRFGAVRSKFRLADSELLNHRLEVEEGVLAGECLDLLLLLKHPVAVGRQMLAHILARRMKPFGLDVPGHGVDGGGPFQFAALNPRDPTPAWVVVAPMSG